LDVWFREEQLALVQAGQPMVVSRSSIFLWRRRLVNYCHTGNRARTTIIRVDLLHLVIYIMAWPHATFDKMATFLWNKVGGLFSRQAISRRLKEICVTKKGCLLKLIKLSE
jgi:hypothetical protein